MRREKKYEKKQCVCAEGRKSREWKRESVLRADVVIETESIQRESEQVDRHREKDSAKVNSI